MALSGAALQAAKLKMMREFTTQLLGSVKIDECAEYREWHVDRAINTAEYATNEILHRVYGVKPTGK